MKADKLAQMQRVMPPWKFDLAVDCCRLTESRLKLDNQYSEALIELWKLIHGPESVCRSGLDK